jgi:hypothetical protein
MGPQVFRVDPQMPTANYKTYTIARPTTTHWRPATCLEVDCQHYKHGWATTVMKGSEDEALIRTLGKRFLETNEPNGFVRLVFYPEQPCFRASAHRVPVEREPLYVVRGGDWRGNPRGEKRVHTRGADWVDDFATHQDKLATRLAQG